VNFARNISIFVARRGLLNLGSLLGANDHFLLRFVIVVRVFISYATPDRVTADEVSGWLLAAGHEPFLDHDRISVGEDWKQRLYRELRRVDAVIAVVTSSSLASNWCSAELGIADALGCRLMPLRAEVGVVHPLMQDLQYADYQADPQQARDRVLQAMRLLDDGGSAWQEGNNPFPGLEPFTAALSRVFFGRSAEAREVCNRLRAMDSTGGILAIIGPSGCGKSSLLNAAVAPLLDSDPAWLGLPSLVPGSDPLPELARALAATATRLGVDWSAGEVRDRLEAGGDGLRRVADDLLAAGPSRHQSRLLVPIDQAEEMFTRTSPAAQQQCAELLHHAVTGPVRVVAAMRSEFLDDLRDLPALADVPIEAYVLAPLSRESLRDVIEEPAKVTRLRLDNGLAAALVTDTGSGEALPLLAFTLRQLASGLPPGGTLTLARYHDLGGVRGALTRHADAALTEAIQASDLTEREVLAGLTRLITVDDTGRRARRRIKLTGVPAPLRAALDVFVNRRLLLSGTDDDGQIWLTVAHEALLTGWRPLDTATVDITAALRTARVIEQAAADWNDAGRPEHHLWDTERLTTARTTLGMAADSPETPPIVELDEEARAFLDAAERRVAAIEDSERRRRTRTLTVLSTLLVLALIAAGLAVWQQQRASSAHYTAIARNMVAQADRIRDRNPRGALQLGVAASQLDPSPQTQASIRETLSSTTHFWTLRGHTRAVYGVAVAPDGRTLATASGDRTIRLWDLTDREHPRPIGEPLTIGPEAVNGAVFSPDGRTLVTANGDNTVRLWDFTNRDRPRQLGQPLLGHTGWVVVVAFSTDGRTVATASRDQTAILWDLTNRDQPRQLGQPLTHHSAGVNTVAFAPDGHTLATASSDQTVRLWDLTNRDHPQQLGPPLTGDTAAFAPDGHILATASSDQTVRLWDLTNRDHPRQLGQPLTGHADAINGVAFAPNGHILATTSDDQTVRLWDLTDRDHPRQLGQPLTGHTGAVLKMAFLPDGHTLATTSLDQTAILWDLTDDSQPQKLGQALTGHTEAINEVIFAPNGGILATTGADRTVRLWDLSNPNRPLHLSQPLSGHTGAVHGVAFAPDGRTLATADDDRTVRLWDLSDPNRPRQLGEALMTGHANAVNGVAFAPDGHTLAIAGGIHQKVELWDLSDLSRPQKLDQPLSTRHIQEVYDLAFSPDGRILATASGDQTVRLWDLSDRNRPRQLGSHLTGHTDAVYGAAFAPDGRTLATASLDGTVRLWDLTDPSLPGQLGQPLIGHTGGVNGVAFAPDGRTLATASSDQTVRLWDLSDLKRPRQRGRTLTGHTGGVNSVAFAPDGRTLTSASSDKTIILWDVPRSDWTLRNELQEACMRAGAPLDEATWDQYAPEVSYQDTCAER
jgi:WD40 repeat protein